MQGEVRVSVGGDNDKAIVKKALEAVKRIDSDNPTQEDFELLQQAFDNAPQLWQRVSDVSEFVRAKLVGRLVSGALGQQALRKRIDVMREGLGHGGASQLEQLLIDNVALCWLRLQYVEWNHTQVISGESIPIAQADYWEKRLSVAQRRFLRACETLARVSKLVRRTPALQVNIATDGGQQVNVAGDLKR